MWSSGEVVAVREIWHGRVWKARPWIVVEDQPERLVLWIPRGAATMIPDSKSPVPVGEWTLVGGSFGTSALRVTRPGEAHSILHFFDGGGAFQRWYVNLERPLERSSVGFELVDLFLDLVIERDGSHRWVDEDELEQALEAGLLSAEEAAAARDEGEAVLAESPFPTGWEDWRPDPAWRTPALPGGWDRI